jgi:hypothetical protein
MDMKPCSEKVKRKKRFKDQGGDERILKPILKDGSIWTRSMWLRTGTRDRLM